MHFRLSVLIVLAAACGDQEVRVPFERVCSEDMPCLAGSLCNGVGVCVDDPGSDAGVALGADAGGGVVPGADGGGGVVPGSDAGGVPHGDAGIPPAPGCGDGVLQPGEGCDDGNQNAADGCTDQCRLASCGDGVHRQDLPADAPGGEACDDGNTSPFDACLPSCRLARCGDGIVQAGVDGCDDGNNAFSDGCGATCVIEQLAPDCRWVGGRDQVTIYCPADVRRQAAAAVCRLWQGDLVTVISEPDNAILSAAVNGGEDDAWIGLNDSERERRFVWDGRASDYRNWRRGDDENRDNRDCAVIREPEGTWKLRDCTDRRPFLCEKPAP
jgi:cysteine-rich repeat protein